MSLAVRWLLVGAVLAGSLALGACGGRDAASGTGPAATTAADASVQGIAETKALLDGIPQDGLVLGDENAPVTLVEIADLQCPFCRKHQLDVQPRLIKHFVRTGRVQIHLLPVAFLGADSQRMEVVFLRLAQTNRAWQFANLVYWNQGQEGSGYATDGWLRSIVGSIPGTDASAASTTPDAAITQAAAATMGVAQNAVRAAGGGGTPFFTIGRSRTPLVQLTPILTGSPPDAYATLAKAIETVEAGKQPKPLRVGPAIRTPSTAKGA